MSRFRLPVSLPIARKALLAAILGFWPYGFAAPARADEPPGKEPAKKPKITFSPEIEEKLTKFFKKAGDAEEKLLTVRTRKQIEEVTNVAGLSADQIKALEDPAKQAVGQSMTTWFQTFGDRFRQQYQWVIPQAIAQMLPQAELYVGMGFVGQHPPEEESAWIQGLKRVLTLEQAALWEKTKTERRQSAEKEISDFLQPMIGSSREEATTAMLAKSDEVKTALSVSKETAARLDALAKSTAGRMTETWQKRAVKTLLALDEEERRKVFKNGNPNFSFEDGEQEGEAQLAAWKKDLATVLSPEEAKRWQDMIEQRESRHTEAMGRAFITELDRKIAFTASQREKLFATAKRLVQDDPRLKLPEDGNRFYGYSPIQSIFAAAVKASDAELSPILDAIQLRHWQDLRNPKNIPEFNSAPEAAPENSAAKAAEAPLPEPEDLENGISDFLFENTHFLQRRVLAEMVLKAEDAARIAGLPPDVASQLQTAARGSAERTVGTWRENTEQMVRANLSDATAQNVKERLGRMEQNFSLRFSQPPFDLAIWNKAVDGAMSTDQRAAWQKELDARQHYLDETIVQIVMISFDNVTSLRTEQWNKIEPLIAGVMKEYGPDIATVLGNFRTGEGGPWYMQAYRSLPFAGVPEKDLQAILSKEQWEQWTGSGDFNNCSNLWPNLQRNHEQRAKVKK